MSFTIPPVDGLGPRPEQLGALRFRRRRLPPEVAAQLDAAAQLYDDLLDAGVELRFDAPGHGARLRAILVDVDGHEVREVPLTDVVALEVTA